ncbi:hypothetical protein ZEAMMB73_Zm00001d019252 [Zea mays]|jgi:hypothetical protein|uniref:Uncharacterized protein n=1 Tax=Zea mays TaxID=4577 RepID=A0A1D6HWG1_MAIZE|nr:hypothetical protein ZEAMMB73_Zm00001d019252 [Zea mays]ONM52555.1 hypothetical protein ZEAMMB73_Zm00001d019252 [Zea mays]ONM52560.1 hypothetical protein ZEAMMB73_Zm00001d019252 [Zea mays]ONM52563.1 hypothetical protein ZEAMMB73_Zm00001d019252 [Zea mays]ONM52564.1 hypothetical protein ZEAMMB73_Zm00001d019252 [Zea mays]
MLDNTYYCDCLLIFSSWSVLFFPLQVIYDSLPVALNLLTVVGYEFHASHFHGSSNNSFITVADGRRMVDRGNR